GNRVRHGNKLVTWGFIAVLGEKGIHSRSWEIKGLTSKDHGRRGYCTGTWGMENGKWIPKEVPKGNGQKSVTGTPNHDWETGAGETTLS
nr:hypothetical protein [Tanacetum cinerariifolium]